MAEKSGYTVLARRYRPQTFGSVVGQQHVAQALKNAIHGDRVAHAYLFTGARGVGKTSMARILAKALNCEQTVDGEPCNQCDICQAISAGNDVDVMEIDGASNRGIDDIRSLRANVGIRSMRTLIKMYIIDEVHMLTKEAFNALLKTLEEPPPNVKFVFCTTEPQKVPDTILSRCQRFDFSSIETQKIAERLTQIAEQEGMTVTPEAVDLVARRAGGSMRDSQSLFDQLLAFGNEKIEAADVNLLLGTADDERLLKIMQFSQQRQLAELLEEVDQAIQQGVQIGNLLDQLVNCYRDLMILACGADRLELIGVAPHSRAALQKISVIVGIEKATAAMQILSEAKSKLARVAHGRALLDLALIRISQLENLDGISQLISDLKRGQMPQLGLGRLAAAGPENPPPVPQLDAVPTQKKSPELAPTSIPAVINTPAAIPFEESQKHFLWSQLIDIVDDTIRSNLSKVDRYAIIAPNRLDIYFPANYAFSKAYFDGKPELVRQLETCLKQLTGQAVQVRFYVESATMEMTTKSSDNRTQAPQNAIEKPAFVQSAEAIFSASTARSERLRKTTE